VSRFDSSRLTFGARAALLLLVIAFVASCSLGEVTVSKTVPVVVVHSVLNPSATNQVVLVERTL